MDCLGLSEYQKKTKAEIMASELSVLAKRYSRGTVEKIEIILNYQKTETINGYVVMNGEDYAVLHLEGGRCKFVNITGDSDWCIIDEIVKAVSREVF